MMRILGLATAFLVSTLALPAAALPTADEVLEQLGFSADAKQQVLAGQVVNSGEKPTSDRELSAALAFLVNKPPSELIAGVRKSLLMQVDPGTLARVQIHGAGSLDDFKGVAFATDAKKQVELYLDAKPGSDLNLSASEIAAFKVLDAKSGGGSAQKLVEAQLRQSLLSRYQAYQSKGLEGIASYERGGGKQSPASGDLKRANEAATGFKKYLPAFYNTLIGYPNSQAPELEQIFQWTHYDAHGTPVFILTHRFWMPEGDGWVLAVRQYYVSGSYNVGQALVGLLPVDQGTLVVYLNRTSTDQVAGFGGSTKRSLGSKIMISQLEDLFHQVKAAAEKSGD
jgi:hypothetical protein